ncbi:MAG: nickel pincer cofactor biosynthesis protein LarB [Planctomycetota bacterium]
MATELFTLLRRVREGDVSPEDAEATLSALLREGHTGAAEALGFATIDHDRAERCGSPEVIYGQGKTPEQVVAIARSILQRSGCVLATRLSHEAAAALEKQADANIVGRSEGERFALLLGTLPAIDQSVMTIPVVCAGTTDLPVADEVALTCTAMGQPTHRINDVGVAGLHRILARVNELRDAAVVVVVAGMEGALPSVVAGLIDAPVIAVPTSVGYGTHFNGVAALLGMLNSCGSGVTVVNIDNGFGAGFAASKINRRATGPSKNPKGEA